MRFFLFILIFFLSSNSFSEQIYNGELSPFGGSVAWDKNSSSIVESSVSPFSPTNHLRATINNYNWWGAVGYVLNKWNPVDFTDYKTISIALKSDSGNYAIGVSLFDGDQKASLEIKVDPLTTYDIYTIPLSAFEGVNLSAIKVIVFSVSRKDTATYIIDIDDITLDKEILPPDES